MTNPVPGVEHRADLYHDTEGMIGVIPTCRCGWEIPKVPTYDEAADAYADHRLEAAHSDEQNGAVDG